jgi:hypothetical protein
MSGRKFTWANNLPSLTFEKLDRVLVTMGGKIYVVNNTCLTKSYFGPHTALVKFG